MFIDGLQMRNVLSGVKLIDHEQEKATGKGIVKRNRRPDRSLFQLPS